MEIANFTSALTEAFALLERYRTKKVRLRGSTWGVGGTVNVKKKPLAKNALTLQV
jgi:hypothetical protein